MSKVNNLSAAFSALAGALRGNVEEERSNIQTAWDASRHYDNNNAIDLYDFCDELASTTDSETLKQAAESVKAALISDDSGFIAQYWRDANSWRTTDGQRCLSVFFPENPSALKSYSSLDFVQSGPGQLWCEFLTAYFKKGGGRGAKDGGAGRDLEGRGVPESSLASQADMALAAVCLSAESACGANTTWSAAWTVDPTSPCPITPVALITPDGTSTRAAADAVLDRSVADRWELDGELVADVAVRSSAREDMGATSHCRYAALQALMTEEDQYGFTGTDLGRKQVGWPLKAPYRRLNSDSAKPSQGTSTPGRLEPARA